jgi:hypothetical protein
MGKLARTLNVLICLALLPVAVVEVSQRVRADLTVPAPLAPMPMPFLRAGEPSVIPGTPTPQQYVIVQPDDTVTYRAFNPCATADVRIETVEPDGPLVTQPTPYPGVLKVTSKVKASITKYTGTRYGRGSETMGSTRNPMGGPQRVVSIMTVPIPGYSGDISNLVCEFELHYGRSG